MLWFAIKTLVTAVLVAGISELSKRSGFLGALLASLPLTSVLAMLWLYWQNRNPNQIAELSRDILWLVIPSLTFFAILPWLIRQKLPFWACMLLAWAATALVYGITVWLMRRLGQ